MSRQFIRGFSEIEQDRLKNQTKTEKEEGSRLGFDGIQLKISIKIKV